MMIRKMRSTTNTVEKNKADAAGFVTKDKKRDAFRVSTHETTRLQVGMVIQYSGDEWIVDMVIPSRARILPLNKRRKVVQFTNKKGEKCEFTPETTGGPVSIAANSDVPILRRSSPSNQG